MKKLFIMFLFINNIGFCQSTPQPNGDHAHPENYRQISATVMGGILRFEYEWDSSSGNPSDLSRVWVGEHVTCPNNGILSKPPWKSNFPTPTIRPSRSSNNGPDCGLIDTHYPPGSLTWMVPPLIRYPDSGYSDTFTTTQNYGYHCRVCDPTPADDTLGWQISLFPTISITRYTERNGMYWRYRITKSGETASVQLN